MQASGISPHAWATRRWVPSPPRTMMTRHSCSHIIVTAFRVSVASPPTSISRYSSLGHCRGWSFLLFFWASSRPWAIPPWSRMIKTRSTPILASPINARWIMEQRSATVTVDACAIRRRTSRAEAGLARIPTEIIVTVKSEKKRFHDQTPSSRKGFRRDRPSLFDSVQGFIS